MLGEEALRLLREKWANPTMLAEELYVLLSAPDIPITTSAPITFTAPPGGSNQAPLQFDGYRPSDPLIQINRTNAPPIVFSGDGINLGGASITGAGITIGDLGTTNLDGIPRNVEGQPLTGPIPSPGGLGGGSSSGGNAFPGVVVSGSGDTYLMTVYANGTTKPGKNVTVKQLQIDGAEAIPPGTWGVVCLAGTEYSVQAPVWL